MNRDQNFKSSCPRLHPLWPPIRVLVFNKATPPSLSRWLAGLCTTVVMISSAARRSAKAKIHRGKLGGVGTWIERPHG